MPGLVHLSSIVTVRLPRQPALRPAWVQANLEPPPLPWSGPSDRWEGNDDMAAERSEVRVSGWRRRLWSDRRWGWRTADSGGWAGGNTARWTSDGTEPDQPTPERETERDFNTSKLNSVFYMKWSHVCCCGDALTLKNTGFPFRDSARLMFSTPHWKHMTRSHDSVNICMTVHVQRDFWMKMLLSDDIIEHKNYLYHWYTIIGC